jgi:hypothetical protein
MDGPGRRLIDRRGGRHRPRQPGQRQPDRGPGPGLGLVGGGLRGRGGGSGRADEPPPAGQRGRSGLRDRETTRRSRRAASAPASGSTTSATSGMPRSETT